MKNLMIQNFCKKITNSLLNKLLLLLSVSYVVVRYNITVTKYCFTWCSVVRNVIF
jgi:hypothetical protein